MFQVVFGVLVAWTLMFPSSTSADEEKQRIYNTCIVACVATDRQSHEDRKQRCEKQCEALKP